MCFENVQVQTDKTNEYVSPFRIEQVKDDDKLLNFYTGFPSFLHLLTCFNFLGPAAAVLSYDPSKVIEDAAKACAFGRHHILDPLNEFFLMLCRLRLGMPEQDLAFRFQMSQPTVSRIFNTWINFDRSDHQKLAQSLLQIRLCHLVRAIRWGREHESVAVEEYSQTVSLCYPHLSLRKSGMYIGNPAYLGASPDGVLVDESGTVTGIIEIKCPYSAAKLTVQEACSYCSDFYCYVNDNGEVKLNDNHAHYFQVLGTMAVTGAQFCDFNQSQWKYYTLSSVAKKCSSARKVLHELYATMYPVLVKLLFVIL